MTAEHPLDNPAFHALAGPHAGFAEVHGTARRYRPDVSMFAAAERLDERGWDDLLGLAGPGALVLLVHATIPDPPEGWRLLMRVSSSQMVAPSSFAERPPVEVRPLVEDDTAAAIALVELAKPGPFAPRTVDLGGYVGVFDGDRLVAMAGGRMRPPGHREISAVATHPDARGRGLGSAVTVAVAEAFTADGEQPFLHVSDDNVHARRVYDALGFTVRRAISFALVKTPGSA